MSDWTPDAQRRWGQLPGEIQQRLLAKVWCPHCAEARRMDLAGGTIVVDDLVLAGTCTTCGRRVARLIEGEPPMMPAVAEADFQPGDSVIWLKRLPGGPYVTPLTATVVSRTAKRVKIVADDEGQQITRYVPIESLERRG